MQSSRNSLSPVIIVAIFMLMLSACSNSDAIPSPSQDDNSSAMMQSSETAVVPGKKYADGTFAADGGYRSPAGAEEVHVSLILKDDVITDATFEGTATNPKSVKMQAAFAAGFKEQIVGKSIDDLNLTVVNGSSLTPEGFMDALATIKAEAKA